MLQLRSVYTQNVKGKIQNYSNENALGAIESAHKITKALILSLAYSLYKYGATTIQKNLSRFPATCLFAFDGGGGSDDDDARDVAVISTLE